MPQQSTSCPALFIAAPSSGEGKTTITAAIARYHKNQGKKVIVFKTGPDYLDPQILAQASGNPVEQLDMWMCGEAYCQQKLYEAALVADLILVEGVMGIFDGSPSSADLSAKFGIPIALVMNVKGMAQTAAALVAGIANYRNDINITGFIANNCSSQRHRDLIEGALPSHVNFLAALPRDENVALPERHLGLVQANEVSEILEERFNLGATWIENSGFTQLPKAIEFQYITQADNSHITQYLQGVTVAIANDAAFSFIYAANVRLLQQMGATCVYFSPLNDKNLPQADALWLPGGYPELHSENIANNQTLLTDIRHFQQAGKPILAECGGLLYCLESLTTLDEQTYPMLGVLSGHGAMRGKRGCQGMQYAIFPEGELRGHAHHRSRTSDTPIPLSHGRRQHHEANGEAIYRDKGLTATYLHLFFPSNPLAISKLLTANFDD